MSFSGLEPRKWDGVDMLDMQQMLPRAIGGTLCMFATIALVAVWCYHIIGGRLSHAMKETEGIPDGAHVAGARGRVSSRPSLKHKAAVHRISKKKVCWTHVMIASARVPTRCTASGVGCNQAQTESDMLSKLCAS